VVVLELVLGSTRTSPAETPLVISVVLFPTSPICTGVAVSVPFFRIVTVCRVPSVVTADDGTTRTPVEEPVVIDTLAVAPTFTPSGALSNETVTG
jgi:hypothetical protein